MAKTTGRKRPDPSATARRRTLLLVGFALFLVADIALAAVALTGGRTPANTPANTAAPVAPQSPSAAPSPSSTPTPTATVPPVAAVLPARIIVAADASLAWRATTGACPATQATPEITTNSGAKWTATNATTPTGIRSLQSIAIEGKRVASMIGQAGQDCSVELVRTFVSGTNYEKYPAALAGAWYVNPLDRASVHTPAGTFPAPCKNVLVLAHRNASSAAMLCDDQKIHTTKDGGATWSGSVSIRGALNLAPSAAGYVVAAVGSDACKGVQVLSIAEPAETAATATGCLPTDAPPSTLSGNITLSEGAGTLWLWAGDVLKRSTDGGVSWL